MQHICDSERVTSERRIEAAVDHRHGACPSSFIPSAVNKGFGSVLNSLLLCRSHPVALSNSERFC
jgi:hypothetical protein